MAKVICPKCGIKFEAKYARRDEDDPDLVICPNEKPTCGGRAKAPPPGGFKDGKGQGKTA